MTDNFNTEYTERLHIDLAKDAYEATNHKDEFTQMARWLERKEKMFRHEQFIEWRLQQHPMTTPPHPKPRPDSIPWGVPGMDRRRTLTVAKYPTQKSVSLDRLQADDGYAAPHFLPALSRFICLFNNPTITRRGLDKVAEFTFIPSRYLPVWHTVKWTRRDHLAGEDVTADSIHVHPCTTDSNGRVITPARFDTAIVADGSVGAGIMPGRRIGRIRVVFSLPPSVVNAMFENPAAVPSHLVYVEWFSPFRASCDAATGMYQVSKSMLSDGTVLASIVPLSHIYRSVHLFPKFGPVAPSSWTSSNVLDKCSVFYMNPFTDRHLYVDLQQQSTEK
jgi:hypothetical protein